MEINIIPTSNSEHLAKILSKNPDFNIHYLQKNKDGQRFFPDGEIYVRLDKIHEHKGKTVILHAGAPKPNDGLIELEFILTFLRDNRVKPVELFITYFPYGMQDAEFEEGEINAAEALIKRWTEIYGVEKIYIIDAHFFGKDWTNKYPIQHVSAFELLKKEVYAKYPEIFLVAPDAGSNRRTNLPGVLKKRKDSHNVEIICDENFETSVKGKIVGVVDDIIETGGTMVKINRKCKEFGASKVIAIATHGVLKNGVDKIKKVYDDLFLTNTINCENSNVDISNLITDSLWNL